MKEEKEPEKESEKEQEGSSKENRKKQGEDKESKGSEDINKEGSGSKERFKAESNNGKDSFPDFTSYTEAEENQDGAPQDQSSNTEEANQKEEVLIRGDKRVDGSIGYLLDKVGDASAATKEVIDAAKENVKENYPNVYEGAEVVKTIWDRTWGLLGISVKGFIGILIGKEEADVGLKKVSNLIEEADELIKEGMSDKQKEGMNGIYTAADAAAKLFGAGYAAKEIFKKNLKSSVTKSDGKPDVHVETQAKGKVDDIKLDPYQEAMREGGKHQIWAKQYVDKPDIELERGIRSIDKQIKNHQDKIANPTKTENWNNLRPEHQQDLISKKWPSDIKRQEEQKLILEGILKNRGNRNE
ncbi:hypothetical protein NF27_GC00010 [Candidatus Jidaibacter acanthamoeba]|uniref:Uncharacterized protein n=1 Tax=Candidatus Jidaibacter acanthamoebae TaxID=86105 RepID=A0A0C1MRN0_9RICK|nr:hypothetical protein NF27_GC00010 [Candidatus Jidaibacter acanthamoeba]